LGLSKRRVLSYLLISPMVVGLIVGLCFLSVDPLGHTTYKIMGKQPKIRSITLITMCILTLVLYFFFYPHLPLHIRFVCSFIIPALGLFYKEFLWHCGCWRVWGTGIPIFWGFYCGAIFMCIFFFHTRYNTLKFEFLNLICFFALLTSCTIVWERYVMLTDFYPKLLLFDQGLGPDPHTKLLFLIVVSEWVSWLLIARRGEDNKKNRSVVNV